MEFGFNKINEQASILVLISQYVGDAKVSVTEMGVVG